MAFLNNVYRQDDNGATFLYLDGALRLIPDTQGFTNLFGSSTQMNHFPNAQAAPYGIGNPLPASANLYTLPNSQQWFLTDAFPWNPQQTVLRAIVNSTQFSQLGFTADPSAWPGDPPAVGVPLAIRNGWNWHLQVFISGYYILYNHLCHPENPINPYFASWLGNNFSKAEVKARIVQTQQQIDALKGEVPVAQPTFNPGPGVFPSASLSVSLACPTANATIYYTLDGTDPVAGKSSAYLQPISLNLAQALVIKAVAQAPDSNGVSPLARGDFSFSPLDIAQPVFSPAPGPQATASVQVTITCTTPQAQLYYTTDGRDPSNSSTLYTGPITLALAGGAQSLRAIALVPGADGSSQIASGSYSYEPAVTASPTFSPMGGSFVAPNLSVALSCTTPGASIYTSFGPQIPDVNSVPYATPMNLVIAKGSVTLNAVAQASGSNQSTVASQTYSCSAAWGHAWALREDTLDMIGDLTLTNTNVSFGPGKGGSAAQFSSGAFLQLPTVPADMQSPTFTLAAWACATALPTGGHNVLWVFENAAGSNGPGMFVYPDGHLKGQTRQSDGSYVNCETAPGAVSANSWFQVVLVAGSDNVLRLYLNGQSLVQSAFDGSINVASMATLLAGAENGARNGLVGAMERLYYSSQALTSDQVKALYALG